MADPFSTAASAVGVISLALQLLGGCIQGFILLSTARDFGKDAPSIVCMLNIQEIHLTDWARRAGLLAGDGVLDARLNRSAVEDTLRQLKDLLHGTEKLKTRYGLALSQTPRRAGQQTTEGQLEDDLEPAVTGISTGTMISDGTRRQILARAGIEHQPNIFRRFWWAAVDKDKMEKLTADVRAFVDELRKMLDPWSQDDLLASNRAVASHLVSLNYKFDQLWSLADVLRGQSSGDVATSAELKALRIGLEDEPGLASGVPGETARKSPRRQQLLKRLEPLLHRELTGFVPQKRNEAVGLAYYAGQRVFVEKKTMDRSLRRKIMPRVENLAVLLNLPKDETFRSLTCKGVVDDGNAVSFVFRHPHPESARPEPLTLLDLYSARSGIPPPSLTARVSLALRIARAVQSFHAASWLHKNLRSENVLFFLPASSAAGPARDDLLASSFLAGFAFSRRDSPAEISEQPSQDPRQDIYRHPGAMGEPSASYDAGMDAYSLGAIMVEIAEWRALRYLAKAVVDVDADDVPLSRLAAVRPFLLGEGSSSRLRTKMGDIYADACLLCLSGGEVGRAAGAAGAAVAFDDEERRKVWLGGERSLIDDVVQRLGRCVI